MNPPEEAPLLIGKVIEDIPFDPVDFAVWFAENLKQPPPPLGTC